MVEEHVRGNMVTDVAVGGEQSWQNGLMLNGAEAMVHLGVPRSGSSGYGLDFGGFPSVPIVQIDLQKKERIVTSKVTFNSENF